MVKPSLKIFLPLLISIFFIISGCNIDFLGAIISTDLDERLAERDNFKFLTGSNRAPSFGQEYSFIVLTDTHIEDGNAWGLEELADIIADNSKIKFVVVLGDITQYGGMQDLEKFIEIARSFPIPCYPVIGNHDIYFGNWTVWNDRIGSTNYTIRGDGTTLFILDTANSLFGKQQLDRLETEIKETQGRIFVFTHSPLFVKGPVDIQQITDTNERARIISILRNKCDIMFTGHSHKRVINEAGNVRYINIEDFKSTKVYCLVSVTASDVTYTFEEL